MTTKFHSLIILLALLSGFVSSGLVHQPQAQEQRPTPASPPKPEPASDPGDEPVAITEKSKPVVQVEQTPLKSDQFANFRPPFVNSKGEISVLGIYADSATPNRAGQLMYRRSADGKWRRVLEEGEKTADTGVIISSFGIPHVNETGDLTFLADGPREVETASQITDPNDPAAYRPFIPNKVLYKKGSTGIKTLYKMGTEVPNMPSYITGITNISSNSVGTTSFIGTYVEPDGRGLFFVNDGVVKLIARSGQKLGKNETGSFSEHYYPSAINDRNEVAFLGRSGEKSGIFIGSLKGVEMVAFGGRPSPLKGSNFIGFGNRTPTINNRGDVAFIGFFDGPEAGRGLFFKPVDGPLRLVARSGEVIPGTNWNFTDFNAVSLNDNGDIAFAASFAGRSRGIFVKTIRGVLETVALQNQRIPGGEKEDVFNHFTAPDINSRGEVVFYAQWRTPRVGVNIGVFWRDPQGTLRMLFQRGDQMPK
jgi:hypothetical protein